MVDDDLFDFLAAQEAGNSVPQPAPRQRSDKSDRKTADDVRAIIEAIKKGERSRKSRQEDSTCYD
jgi:hypothetical protein